MATAYSICLGTAGWGLWHSPDGGAAWTRHRAPFPLNSCIQALAAHPKDPSTVFAAGDTGLFVSRDSGANWSSRARVAFIQFPFDPDGTYLCNFVPTLRC